MLYISPTNYVKKIYGNSWQYLSFVMLNYELNFKKMFFYIPGNNCIQEIMLGDAWFMMDKGNGFMRYTRLYAKEKICIVGIGDTVEEAKEFMERHRDLFSRFRNTDCRLLKC